MHTAVEDIADPIKSWIRRYKIPFSHFYGDAVTTCPWCRCLRNMSAKNSIRLESDRRIFSKLMHRLGVEERTGVYRCLLVRESEIRSSSPFVHLGRLHPFFADHIDHVVLRAAGSLVTSLGCLCWCKNAQHLINILAGPETGMVEFSIARCHGHLPPPFF